MSTHGRRGLLYIYMYVYTIIMAIPAPQPAPYWRICSVRFSGKGRGNIYDFILFIKCSSFLLPLLLAVSLSPSLCHFSGLLDDDIYNFLRTFVA